MRFKRLIIRTVLICELVFINMLYFVHLLNFILIMLTGKIDRKSSISKDKKHYEKSEI